MTANGLYFCRRKLAVGMNIEFGAHRAKSVRCYEPCGVGDFLFWLPPSHDLVTIGAHSVSERGVINVVGGVKLR